MIFNGPAVKKALTTMAQPEKLDRRGGGNLKARQIDWVSMFDEQSNDMENEIKEFRRDCKIEIARLEAEIRAVKAGLEMETEALENQYFPACVYRPMTSTEFNRACWAKYIAAATTKGKHKVEMTEARLLKAVLNYAEVVRKRHVLNFLKAEGYKEWLQQYVNKKIVLLDDAGEVRAAKKFCGSSAGPSTGGASSSGPQTVADFRSKLRATFILPKLDEKSDKLDEHF
ncbi:hypothetical protein MA16_Dca013721 [Dendrobium catenatum]|uniref:Uncharacterized protein n=1 Tax=Dendrobium catenatum TaxID=906689 RepID=A0A2I0VWA7_9ASPA|nr:hypothetical protein MA16_Dca013721 [Dendrobium catenatum]